MVMPRRSTEFDDGIERPATPRTVDFSSQRNLFYRRDDKGLMRVVNSRGYRMDWKTTITTGVTDYDESVGSANFRTPGTGMSATAQQKRARARRRMRRGEHLTEGAWNELYKPLEDWDAEELAKGRPRNAQGNFGGRPPKFVTRELHERAMDRFKTLIRDEMNVHSINALKTIQMILESEEVDHRGKPIVSSAAKMDAAKFLLEHVVGKPVQPTTQDISVKLQGILGAVMVNPAEAAAQQYQPAHIGTRGELEDGNIVEGEVVDDDEEYDGD